MSHHDQEYGDGSNRPRGFGRRSLVTDEMVNRFLSWPLPATVLPDSCVLDRSYPHRSGTHLLNADEARAMLEHVLADSVTVRGGG